jgi:predicted peptidase
MKRLYALLLSFFLLSACMTGDNKPVLQKEIFSNSRGEKIPYRILEPLHPEAGKKYPLVMYFHGAGERGDDNELPGKHMPGFFLEPQNLEQFPCFVIVPQCPLDKRWVEVDWGLDRHIQPDTLSTALRLSMELMDKIIREKAIDTNRLYVTGMSMGGFATWDLITRFPGKFAAAAPVCGGGDETKAYKIIHVPVWAFHGGKDKVVKTIRSRNMISAMEKAGGKPLYTEYPNLGHNAWDSAYRNEELLKWMFMQKKNP